MKKKRFMKIVPVLMLAIIVSCGGGKNVKKNHSASKADENRGQATGYATIFDDDLALARDRATDHAKIKLVRKVLGETISGRSIMKNFELVSTIVEAKSTGMVKDERIIKRWQEGKEYFVTIEGRVEIAAVNDAIADALNTYGRPKFMVLVSEKFDGRRNMPGFTETEMIMQEIMGDSGFEFVDANMTQELMKRQKTKMKKAMGGKISGDVQSLLLNNVGAEVVIFGTAETRDQSAVLKAYGASSMKSKSAIIRLKAVDVYTGRILATISRNAPGIHIEEHTASKKAIENALKKIVGKINRTTKKFESGKFMNSIVHKFVKAATSRQIEIRITGLDYMGLKKFRNQVSQRIRGVSQAISRGQVGRAAKIEIIFAGKTDDFIEELMAKSSNLGFEIKIKESFPNSIVMKVKKIK